MFDMASGDWPRHGLNTLHMFLCYACHCMRPNLLDYDAACVHTMSAWMFMISIKYPGTEIPLGTWLMARAQNTPRMGTCQWGMRAPRARTPSSPRPRRS